MKNLIFIFLLVGFFNCPLFSQSKITNEEYKIYAVVLKEIYHDNLTIFNEKTSFVILNETVKPALFDNSDEWKMKGLSKDFRKKNEAIASLNGQFPVKYKYDFVSKGELEQFFEIGKRNVKEIRKGETTHFIIPNLNDIYWKPFYEKFSDANGYYSFSRIGFDSTKEFAILEVYGEGCDWSSDSTFILIKTKRGWKIYNSSSSRDIS